MGKAASGRVRVLCADGMAVVKARTPHKQQTMRVRVGQRAHRVFLLRVETPSG